MATKRKAPKRKTHKRKTHQRKTHRRYGVHSKIPRAPPLPKPRGGGGGCSRKPTGGKCPRGYVAFKSNGRKCCKSAAGGKDRRLKAWQHRRGRKMTAKAKKAYAAL